jgi:hypothetical protein
MESHLTDISRVIQLAVAPVFLLTAIATMINALNSRLGRIVDRRRVVQERLPTRTPDEAEESAGRKSACWCGAARLVYYAIFGAVLSALLVCLVVAGAFLGALLGVDLARSVAALFIAAMLAMIAALGLFLREVFLAVRSGTHNQTMTLRHRSPPPPSARFCWPRASACAVRCRRCPNPPGRVKASAAAVRR